MVVFAQRDGCIRAKVVVFVQKVVVIRQKWLYLGKSGCIWAKVVVFGQKWLYSGKMIVFG